MNPVHIAHLMRPVRHANDGDGGDADEHASDTVTEDDNDDDDDDGSNAPIRVDVAHVFNKPHRG